MFKIMPTVGQHLFAARKLKLHKILVGKEKSVCVYMLLSNKSLDRN